VTVSVAIGLAIAWVAAAATSLGWLMKSRGAHSSAPMRHHRPWRSVRALFTSRWFAAGVLVASTGGLLHIAALALAPLSTVQAVMASGIVVLGVMAERFFGWPVPGRQWAGVALTAIGLLALALSLPALHGADSAFRAPDMVAFDLVLLAATGLLLLAPRHPRLRGHDGALIGAASGALFAISDIAIKGLFGVAGHALASVLLSPWLATAILSGVLAQYVSARSLQTGDGVSVTALTAVTVNIANIAGGILIFGDPLAHGLAGSLIEAGAFTAICVGAFLTPVRAATSADSQRPAQAISQQPPESRTPATRQPPARHQPRSAPAATGLARTRQRRLRSSIAASGLRTSTAADADQRANLPGPCQEPSDDLSIPGVLASAAAILLIASKLTDLFEPDLGFDTFNLVIAFTLSFVLVGYGVVLGYDLLQTHALRSHAPSRSTTTAGLLALGIGALAVIGIEHLHTLPATDGWLGIAGALLMLAAGIANRPISHSPPPPSRVQDRARERDALLPG